MKYIIAFICVSIIGIAPCGIYFLLKKFLLPSDPNYFFLAVYRKYIIRAIIVVIVFIPLFIFLPDKRTVIIICDVAVQLINTLLMKKLR